MDRAPNFLLLDEVQWQCHFFVLIGSSHRGRAKSPLRTVLIINLHDKGLQCSCRFCTCRHIYMPWNSKEIVGRKCSVGLHSIRLLGSTHSMLTANTPLTLLLVSLTLASEGLHCSTIRCLQALGEKDMVQAFYSIPWSNSLPTLCGESVHLESEVGRRDLSWICETLLLFLC